MKVIGAETRTRKSDQSEFVVLVVIGTPQLRKNTSGIITGVMIPKCTIPVNVPANMVSHIIGTEIPGDVRKVATQNSWVNPQTQELEHWTWGVVAPNGSIMSMDEGAPRNHADDITVAGNDVPTDDVTVAQAEPVA